MSVGERFSFASVVMRKRFQGQPNDCPYCHGSSRMLARKQLILELRECKKCRLMFRYPKDEAAENFDYYQDAYQQTTVTDLPSPSELKQHMETNFRNVGRDLTEHLSLVRQFSSGGRRLLDFGASWGYCTWQFKRAGYDAVGFEISRPRTEYGQKMLGVAMVNSTASIPDHSLDVVYASHVLEHMPDPRVPLQEFRRMLAPGGKVFIFVPNGGSEPARRLGVKWTPLINQKHVMAFTAQFFAHSLAKEGFVPELASSPYISSPQAYRTEENYDGEELLAIGTAR